MPPVGTRGGPPADRLPYGGGGPGGGRGGGGPNSRPIPGRIPADAGPGSMGGGAGMPGMGGGALGGGMEGGGFFTGGLQLVKEAVDLVLRAVRRNGFGCWWRTWWNANWWWWRRRNEYRWWPRRNGNEHGWKRRNDDGWRATPSTNAAAMMADDAELSNLAKRDHDLEQSCRRFADELRQKGKIAADDRSKLQKMVAEHFKVRQDRRLREINLLREQITKLEQQLDRRQQSAEDLTNRRTASLLGEDSGF